jgi:hypothetical protein
MQKALGAKIPNNSFNRYLHEFRPRKGNEQKNGVKCTSKKIIANYSAKTTFSKYIIVYGSENSQNTWES